MSQDAPRNLLGYIVAKVTASTLHFGVRRCREVERTVSKVLVPSSGNRTWEITSS